MEDLDLALKAEAEAQALENMKRADSHMAAYMFVACTPTFYIYMLR